MAFSLRIYCPICLTNLQYKASAFRYVTGKVSRHRKRRSAYDIVYQTKEDLHMSGCNIFEDNCMNWVLLVGIVLVLMMCCN